MRGRGEPPAWELGRRGYEIPQRPGMALGRPPSSGAQSRCDGTPLAHTAKEQRVDGALTRIAVLFPFSFRFLAEAPGYPGEEWRSEGQMVIWGGQVGTAVFSKMS